MLTRIPETEVMDSSAEAADYDAMDHSAVNRLFVADFLKVWSGPSPILDVGTGTALIPVEFCRQSPEGEIIAVDLAAEMLKLAAQNVAAAGFDTRITVEQTNGRQMAYADGQFPAVMSNSIIHHIPEPAACFKEMVRVASADAVIFIRDLLRPDSLEEIDRLVALYAAGANERQRRLFADSLHASLTLEEVRNIVKALGFDPEQVRQTSDRHWTWVKV